MKKFNKKGGIPDGFYLMIALFVIAVVYIMSYVIFSNVNDEIQSQSYIGDSEKTLISTFIGKYDNLLNNIFLFIVVGLAAAVLVGAWFIPSHPALFWFSVPILVFMVWMSGLYANIFNEITTQPQLSAKVADLPIINFIFNNYVFIILGFMLVLFITLFAKRSDTSTL